MSYKPEIVCRTPYTKNAEWRLRRAAKKAAARIMRRMARRDPENAPTRIIRGTIC